jgi:hypothetical protein
MIFHVASTSYVNTGIDDPDYLDIIVNMIDANGDPFDPDDLPSVEPALGWVGPLQLRASGFQMSKGAFELSSSKSNEEDPTGSITRYFDLLDNGSFGDRTRYVDESGKIRFRVRIIRKKIFPAAYDNEDTSHCQLVTDVNPSSDLITWDMLVPWVNAAGDVYDSKFDYRKVGLVEYVKKLGLDYFASLSI